MENSIHRLFNMCFSISASNEPSRRACTDIGRLPRGSNAPLLVAGYLTLPAMSPAAVASAATAVSAAMASTAAAVCFDMTFYN